MLTLAYMDELITLIRDSKTLEDFRWKQSASSDTIALFENDVTKFCTYACWGTNADKDYIVTLIIVPLLREDT